MTFTHWTLDGTAQPAGQATVTPTLHADAVAVAVYQVVQRTLTVQSTPVAGVPILGDLRRDHELCRLLRRQLASDPDGAANVHLGPERLHVLKWTVAGVDQPNGQATATFGINADTTAVAVYQVIKVVWVTAPVPTATETPAGQPAKPGTIRISRNWTTGDFAVSATLAGTSVYNSPGGYTISGATVSQGSVTATIPDGHGPRGPHRPARAR